MTMTDFGQINLPNNATESGRELLISPCTSGEVGRACNVPVFVLVPRPSVSRYSFSSLMRMRRILKLSLSCEIYVKGKERQPSTG